RDLDEGQSGDPLQEVPGWGEDVVPAAEIAGVVVGDGGAERVGELQAARFEQLADELAVVDHLVVTAEVRVLVAEGVEAVGAGRDDLLHPVLRQQLDVLLGTLLEQVLIAYAP